MRGAPARDARVAPHPLKGFAGRADPTPRMRQFAAFYRTCSPGLPTLAVFALALGAQSLGLGESLDRRIHDGLLRIVPRASPAPPASVPDVLVVTIDPRSLRALDDWPWPRRIHASAIERLDAAGARAIAFDIDFSLPSNPEDDGRFADRIAASGHVALATFSQTELLPGGMSLEIVNRPIDSLATAAAATGSVLVPIDPDGVVRQVPRSQTIAGEAIPSLARAALHLAVRESRAGAVPATAASGGEPRVDFRRVHPEIPTLAFVDLLEGRFDPGLVAGRAVFIGATAAEFQDLWATPIAPALPGVMIQALAYRTAMAEMLGEAILRPASPAAVAFGLVALAGLLHPHRKRSHLRRALLFSGTAIAVIGLAWISLWQTGVAWPATIALGVVAAQYALGIEGLERHVRALSEAHASSFDALARVGDLTRDGAAGADAVARPEAGLEIALRLLGDVVSARGVVLLRVDGDGHPSERRLEWRPEHGGGDVLAVDDAAVERVLRDRRVLEIPHPGGSADRDALVVYAPLVAGAEVVGVLVVFGRPGRALDSLQRRTITTVGAQLALTAQNIQLIERLRETFESSIAAVASAVEARDGYTDQHCRRLAAFSSLMGRRLGLSAAEIRAMEMGALLHDVGKIGIRDHILNKPGRLTPPERDEMKRHPEIGAGIVAPVVGLEPTTLHCILHHHECWNGSGYPQGLAGESIPLAARIVAIVDVWDALSTSRPYKPAFEQTEVRDLLRKGAGTQFDPELVELFFEILDEQGDEMLALVARSTATEVAG